MQVLLHQGQSRPCPRPYNRTDSKKEPFLGRFGRKTGVAGEENTIFSCCFSLFRGFWPGKPLILRILHGADSFQKNRIKKPTVGFCFFSGFGNIVA
jgi:hypothetical protein